MTRADALTARRAGHAVYAVCAAALVAACGGRGQRAADTAGPLVVFAASDLQYALPEVARAYHAAGGDSVLLTFGATGALATQIANGAPADAFFAADVRAVDGLARRGVVVDSTRRVYAVGALAVVSGCRPSATSGCPSLTLGDLAAPAVRYVAIANPEHAPYGRAARQALERAGVWARVRPKVVLAANVAQALQLVETGNADAGVVALSVVLGRPGRAYATVPDTLYDALRQGAAAVAASARPAAGVAFVRFVAGPGGQAILRRYGFRPADTAAGPAGATR